MSRFVALVILGILLSAIFTTEIWLQPTVSNLLENDDYVNLVTNIVEAIGGLIVILTAYYRLWIPYRKEQAGKSVINDRLTEVLDFLLGLAQLFAATLVAILKIGWNSNLKIILGIVTGLLILYYSLTRNSGLQLLEVIALIAIGSISVIALVYANRIGET